MQTQRYNERYNESNESNERYNEIFIDLLDKMSNIMVKKGEIFRAKAYKTAADTIMLYKHNIVNTKQLKEIKGIGKTISDLLQEYVETGLISIIEKEKHNPINILCDVYGVGPKKAQDLVEKGITTVAELRLRQDELLNDTQKIGLKYYEDINERIPRSEIDKYNILFNKIFKEIIKKDNLSKYEIVGSYRRGAETSGDIDVIISGTSNNVYKIFVNFLLKHKIITEILSSGESKTLVIAKLNNNSIARRIDFLYSPLNEFAFAILYFTGSKIFNTSMRQHALNKGYTFNEHSIYTLENKSKGTKISTQFNTEQDIFNFLGLAFKHPNERRDGRDIIVLEEKKEKVQEEEKKKEKVQEKEENNLKEEKDKWDKIIHNFINKGVGVLSTLNESQLSSLLLYLNEQYYNHSERVTDTTQRVIVTDNQYDIIKEYIQSSYPNNIEVLKVGAKVEKNEVKLPYYMPSMNKHKPDTREITKWINKYTGSYVVSAKVDGVSVLYTNLDIPKLYTRGNGTFGSDISYLIPYLKLPKEKNIVIRGELLIHKKLFYDKYKQTYATCRNFIIGIVNKQEIVDVVSSKELHFVAYEVIVPSLTPLQQMNYLNQLQNQLQIECILFRHYEKITNEILSNMLLELRESYLFEIDGLIVCDNKIYERTPNCPKHSFAFKMVLLDQLAEAKVVDVLWTPSKDGYLKPRIQIEPINIGGCNIEFVTGINAAFIRDNKIGVGSLVQIVRSGDVIPNIRSIVVPAKQGKMPEGHYSWNDTNIDIILVNPEDNEIVKEKNITKFFKEINVDGLSTGYIKRLINANYDSVYKIIQMTESDFLKVEGVKDKLAKKLHQGIQNKLAETTIINLMTGSNIFGHGFSDKKFELILKEEPDILISEDSLETKIDKISQIKGMSKNTGTLFVDKIKPFTEFLEECGLTHKLFQEEKSESEPKSDLNMNTTHILHGKQVTLTNTRDKEIMEFLKHVGAEIGNVKKTTFLVITNDKDDLTGKAMTAKKLNIPIISVTEFKEQFIKI
jgi:DNA polymerase beta